MEAVERNWTRLPEELLHLIVKKLTDISDFIHARAICKRWRSSISVSDLPPQFPWILKRVKGPDLEFYSISSDKIYTIHAPCSSDKLLFGPGNGYMLARGSGKRGRFSLLNPLNNSEVPLPALDDSESFDSESNDSDADDFFGVFWIGPQSFPSDGNLVAIDYHYRWLVCKAGDDKWDYIGSDKSSICFYLKRLFFVVVEDKTRVTKVMNIGSRKEVYVIPRPEDEIFPDSVAYLVESCGEILRVCCNKEVYEFDIHRLEFGNGEGQPCWVKVGSIGDRILFLDFPAGRGFSLKANDFAGFRGNCIYFTDAVVAYVLGMYDIENGSTVFIEYPFDRENDITWFVPTLNHI